MTARVPAHAPWSSLSPLGATAHWSPLDSHRIPPSLVRARMSTAANKPPVPLERSLVTGHPPIETGTAGSFDRGRSRSVPGARAAGRPAIGIVVAAVGRSTGTVPQPSSRRPSDTNSRVTGSVGWPPSGLPYHFGNTKSRETNWDRWVDPYAPDTPRWTGPLVLLTTRLKPRYRRRVGHVPMGLPFFLGVDVAPEVLSVLDSVIGLTTVDF